MPKSMTPTDPATHLRGSGVKVTRTQTRPAPKQVRRQSPRGGKR